MNFESSLLILLNSSVVITPLAHNALYLFISSVASSLVNPLVKSALSELIARKASFAPELSTYFYIEYKSVSAILLLRAVMFFDM